MTKDELRTRLAELLPKHPLLAADLVQHAVVYADEIKGRPPETGSQKRRGRGRPRDAARDWLDRHIVQVFRDHEVLSSDVGKQPRKGRPTALLDVAEVIYEYCGHDFPSDGRPFGIRRALHRHRLLVKIIAGLDEAEDDTE